MKRCSVKFNGRLVHGVAEWFRKGSYHVHFDAPVILRRRGPDFPLGVCRAVGVIAPKDKIRFER